MVDVLDENGNVIGQKESDDEEGVSKFAPSFLYPKPRLSQVGALL